MSRRNSFSRVQVHLIKLLAEDGSVEQTYELDERGRLKTSPHSTDSECSKPGIPKPLVVKSDIIPTPISSPEVETTPKGGYAQLFDELEVPTAWDPVLSSVVDSEAPSRISDLFFDSLEIGLVDPFQF